MLLLTYSLDGVMFTDGVVSVRGCIIGWLFLFARELSVVGLLGESSRDGRMMCDIGFWCCNGIVLKALSMGICIAGLT